MADPLQYLDVWKKIRFFVTKGSGFFLCTREKKGPMTQNKPFSPMNLNEFEKSKMWKIQFSKFVAIRFDKKNRLFGI